MTHHRPSAARCAVLFPLLACMLATGCRAQQSPVAPDWSPTVSLEPAWTGFTRPVHLTHADDGSGRVFVVELGGIIRVLDDGAVRATPLLDVSPLVSTGGERGLLSVAFPPDHGETGRFYIDYTDANGDSVIARYRVSAKDRSVADPASAEVLLTVRQPYPNHNGGQLAFGPDGYLYVGLGDGGAAGDPHGNAQNPNSLLGKILRIDVSGPAGYAVPSDNPFVGDARVRPEVWALGLRNPWRFSFDTDTGDLYIADVGQDDWEEIDVEPAGSGGRNYGWDLYEGSHRYPPDSAGAPPAALGLLTAPVAEYGHDQGRSITGGHVYRGSRSPRLDGVYFYGDYESGLLWALTRDGDVWRNELAAQTDRSIAGFGQDEEGEVYVLDLESGDILRIAAR